MSDYAPVVRGELPTTVGGLLHEAAWVKAAQDVIGDHETAVKGELRRRVDQVAEQTGTAPTLRADGVTCYLDRPKPRPEVVDRQQYERLLAASGEARQVVGVDCSALQTDIERGEVTAEQLEALRPYLREEWIAPEDYLDRLAAECVTAEDGTLVDPRTGEKLPVVMVESRAPRLSVRVDPQHRKRLAARLRPAEIEGAS